MTPLGPSLLSLPEKRVPASTKSGSDFLRLHLSCASSFPASLLVASTSPYPKMGFILHSVFQASVLVGLSFY